MKLIDDSRDVSQSPCAARTLNIVRQTNGVVRVHAENGEYLFSLVHRTDGKVLYLCDGFGVHTEPVELGGQADD